MLLESVPMTNRRAAAQRTHPLNVGQDGSPILHSRRGILKFGPLLREDLANQAAYPPRLPKDEENLHSSSSRHGCQPPLQPKPPHHAYSEGTYEEEIEITAFSYAPRTRARKRLAPTVAPSQKLSGWHTVSAHRLRGSHIALLGSVSRAAAKNWEGI
jgi:hypothetical protein